MYGYDEFESTYESPRAKMTDRIFNWLGPRATGYLGTVTGLEPVKRGGYARKVGFGLAWVFDADLTIWSTNRMHLVVTYKVGENAPRAESKDFTSEDEFYAYCLDVLGMRTPAEQYSEDIKELTAMVKTLQQMQRDREALTARAQVLVQRVNEYRHGS